MWMADIIFNFLESALIGSNNAQAEWSRIGISVTQYNTFYETEAAAFVFLEDQYNLLGL